MSTKKISLPVEVVPTGVESLIWRIYDQGKEHKKSPWSLCVHEGFNDQSQNVSSTLCWWHVDASKSKEEINKLNELLSQSSKWKICVQLVAYLVWISSEIIWCSEARVVTVGTEIRTVDFP